MVVWIALAVLIFSSRSFAHNDCLLAAAWEDYVARSFIYYVTRIVFFVSTLSFHKFKSCRWSITSAI